MKNLVKYLKPSGRIVIIDNDINDPNTTHRNQPEMLVSKGDVEKWMGALGYHLAKTDLFPGNKWFVVYSRQGKAETLIVPKWMVADLRQEIFRRSFVCRFQTSLLSRFCSDNSM